ncbi:hypothetical protein MHU86_23893 [Fragilaria crotonensis]|nr:hypothetical protein MHU86_23893 [Fragilaria crotonensis]
MENLDGVNFVLQTIGFDLEAERVAIMEAGLNQFEDFRYLTEKDITDMASEFGKRTQAQGRIVFGLGRTKKLTGIMHWVQDCYRAGDTPSHEDFDIAILFEALSRAQIRESDIDLVATTPKQQILNEFPAEDEMYSSFNERMIHRALDGQYYLADSRRVHQLLHGFLQGENTESWIRGIAKYQDGRRDMIALRRHYAGEGNSTRRIADAKKIQTTLHYKSERALPFNKFLDSLQRMFTIFEEENEPLTERAKVDELLTKVQNSGLTAAIAQLRYQLNTTGVTFTVAANHLNSEVSQTPDYQLSRKINAVNTSTGGNGRGFGRGRGGRGGRSGGTGRGGRGGRTGKSENYKTAYYSKEEWEKLSYEERDKIRKERDRKGEQGGTKRSIAEMSTKQLTTAIISSIKAATADAEKTTSENDTSTPKKSDQAGNAFGGKESVKKGQIGLTRGGSVSVVGEARAATN